MQKNDSKVSSNEFEPSMKTLLRIMKTMSEKGGGGKTNLSLSTNLNYGRFLKHISWLEQKGLVESIVKDGKINVALTSNGRQFVEIILK